MILDPLRGRAMATGLRRERGLAKIGDYNQNQLSDRLQKVFLRAAVSANNHYDRGRDSSRMVLSLQYNAPSREIFLVREWICNTIRVDILSAS